MLSGQLTPLSANLVPHPKYFIEDDPTATDGHYQCKDFITPEAITTTIQTHTSAVTTTILSTNTQNTHQQEIRTRSPPNTITTNSTQAISTSGIIGSTVGTGGIFGAVSSTSSSTAPATGGRNAGETPTHSTSQQQQHLQIQQQQQQQLPNCSAAEASGRSAALERAYVHDVYENCEEPAGPIRPRVAQFLAGLDPGSIVCDVGCGNGRYLTSCNPLIYTVGADRCYRLTKVAREKGGEVALCDNLELPFRDESFDAVLSLAVVHHFATTERRVGAIRELARILRIGGRVIISVWALEQRHRRFESQDVLIPWQPPKNRNQTYSDEEDDDDYLPPYHAYTEDSTNSSRSAGDGDSSSLSSSSPGESCYSFVRRAIQKLAGGRKHPWFLDSWNSKDTKNDSSLDYEDAKDLPIELRRLEDFEDFPEPPLSAGLKSRSLGSILNPPPRQIVRSRSSVPSLGAQIQEPKPPPPPPPASSQLSTLQATYVMAQSSNLNYHNVASGSSVSTSNTLLHQDMSSYNNKLSGSQTATGSVTSITGALVAGVSAGSSGSGSLSGSVTGGNSGGRRPKLVKQKQSLCDDEYQLPDNPFHMIGNSNYSNSISMQSSKNQSIYNSNSSCNNVNYSNNSSSPRPNESRIFLRKQSSLNEELMAESRLREKERIRKRIQKQMSLNESFLCRSLFTKRLQIIREGFTTKLKTSTGSLERVTKNGFVKIMQNFKSSQFATSQNKDNIDSYHHSQYHNFYHHHHQMSNGKPAPGTGNNCATASVAGNNVNNNNNSINNNINNNNNNNNNNNSNNGNEDQKPRRHSRESGSDSSKDSSLQSDTSIESEDSFASVIYIPRPDQQNKCSTTNCGNSSSNGSNKNHSNSVNCISNNSSHKIPSVPTSPLAMPCPPTPAHSPAAAPTTLPTPNSQKSSTSPKFSSLNGSLQGNGSGKSLTNCFTFDDDHIQQQHQQQLQIKQSIEGQKQYSISGTAKSIGKTLGASLSSSTSILQKQPQKITRQIIKELPQIPKFRRQQSLQQQVKAAFPIVRRASAAPAVPKLSSLEIYNPATDDLDSDSSEPSSPDSIDSVISALKPCEDTDALINIDKHKNIIDTTNRIINKLYKSEEESKTILKSIQNTETRNDSDKITPIKCDNDNLPINRDKLDSTSDPPSNKSSSEQNLAEFAEQLNAQLLKELETNKVKRKYYRNDSFDNDDHDVSDKVDQSNSGHNPTEDTNFKKLVNDSSDYRDIREELRERRLRLANLSSSSSKRSVDSPPNLSSVPLLTSSKSPSSVSSSPLNLAMAGTTSSLPALSRGNSLGESNNSAKEDHSSGNHSYNYMTEYQNLRQNHYSVIPDTTYLMQDDGDNSSIDYDDNYHDSDDNDIEHDVILEEDEEDDDDDGGNNVDYYNPAKCKKVTCCSNDNLNNTLNNNNDSNFGNSTTNSVNNNLSRNNNIVTNQEQEKNDNNNVVTSNQTPPPLTLDSRPNTESWGHSNSTTSLDSPSQGGGSTTHHRYYHVFREGELDALINHHVTSLHIVSSYYERASWCVVAEKVQVWTI